MTMKEPEGDKTRKGRKEGGKRKGGGGGELNGNEGASRRQKDKNRKKNRLVAAKGVIKINHRCHIRHLCTALSKNIVVIARLRKTK